MLPLSHENNLDAEYSREICIHFFRSDSRTAACFYNMLDEHESPFMCSTHGEGAWKSQSVSAFSHSDS